MEYKVIGDDILLRLDPGDEVVAAIRELAAKENLKLAKVQGLGAAKKVVMGVYDLAEQKFCANTYEGTYEITALVGSIDTMAGAHYSHLHITIADKEGKAYGGHLAEAIISATAEIVITKINAQIDREKDTATGLNVWKL